MSVNHSARSGRIIGISFRLQFFKAGCLIGRVIMKGCVQWNPVYDRKEDSPQAQLEPQTARSVDQRLTQLSSWAPVSKGGILENNSFYLQNIKRRKYLIHSTQIHDSEI